MRLVLVVALGGDGADHHHSQPPSSLLSLGEHVHMAQEAKPIFVPWTTEGSCGSRLWKDLPWTTISSRIIMNRRLKHGMHYGCQIFRVYSRKIYTSWSFCQHEWLFVTGLWTAEFLQSDASTRVCIQMSYMETGQVLSHDKVQPKSQSALGLLQRSINHAKSGLKGLGFHTFVLHAAW